MSFLPLIEALKGGPSSGNFGHAGRPRKIGGSAPARSSVRPMRIRPPEPDHEVVASGEPIDINKTYGKHSGKSVKEAMDWLEGAILSSRLTGQSADLSDGAKSFLQESVEGNPILYRGIGIIKAKVSGIAVQQLHDLEVGSVVPSALKRQVSDISSYTKKKSVANAYTEGAMSIMTKAQDRTRILVDLENVPKVLKNYNIHHDVLDSADYFKQDKEVFVLEPIQATVESVKGRLS